MLNFPMALPIDLEKRMVRGKPMSTFFGCRAPRCWPIFYCPEATNNSWLQAVDDQKVIETSTGAITCSYVKRRQDSGITATCEGQPGSGGGECSIPDTQCAGFDPEAPPL